MLVIALTPLLQFSTTAHALSQKQKQIFDAGILYYDYNFAKNDCSVTATGASNSNVYVVGDSYSEGMQSAGLESSLKAQGYTNITINGHTGRSINNGGNQPNPTSALTAIEADTDKIKAAGTILIVLGTNPDDYDKSIPIFMKQINSINGSARKFWVNIGNKQQPASYIKATNDTINKYADTFNYSVIDWGAKFASNPSLSGGLHPTSAGYTTLVAMTVAAFGKAETAVAATSTTTAKGTTLADINAEKIWAYFIGKGLTPIQTAGILGNIQSESASTFDPRIVQGGRLSDTLVPNIGYGLSQWTSSGRQQNLIKFAAQQGKSVGDLSLQLDYIWKELNGGYKNALADLRATNDIREATSIILNKYEMPAERINNLNVRTRYATELLAKYAGVAGQTFGCTPGQGGAGGWDLSGANAMTYYSQYDKKWANTPYGTCTILIGGCGPTSAAMIISTLTGDKSVTPPVIAKKLEALGAVPACGTDWDKWSELMKSYNLKLANIGFNFDEATKTLNAGGLVLASFGSDSGPTMFTSGRHLMVIRKVNPDGSFSLADPIALDRDSNKLTYTKEVLLSRDGKNGGAINQMWAVSK